DLNRAFEGTQSMAKRSFGSDRVFIEKFVSAARHVEVQVLGQADGSVIVLGERDCSAQRRHQKLVEESPAPHLAEATRQRMHDSAVKAAKRVGYLNAGTVEFLLDAMTGDFVFLEMNTRIQVEHPVTELTHGVDLVEQQLAVAQTGAATGDFGAARGHAIEIRVCAEDPKRFFPCPGTIDEWVEPTGPGIRVDAGYGAGNTVTPYFDSLLAKVCAFGETREVARQRAVRALETFVVTGVRTNLPFLRHLLGSEEFVSGRYDTNVIDAVKAAKSDASKRS
ncbi:MAG: acetyl/propionyl-CoA carboxylase subunit alpha, partial [Sciscionella sp.]